MAQAAAGGNLPSFQHLPTEIQEAIVGFAPEDAQSLALVSKVFQRALEDPQSWLNIAQQLKLQVPAGMNAKAAIYAEYERKVNNYITYARQMELGDSRRIDTLATIPNVFQRYAALKKVLSEGRMDAFIRQDITIPQSHNRDHVLKWCDLGFLRMLHEVGIQFDSTTLERIADLKSFQEFEKLDFLLSIGIPLDPSLLSTAILEYSMEGNIRLWQWTSPKMPAIAGDYLEAARPALNAESYHTLSNSLHPENR